MQAEYHKKQPTAKWDTLNIEYPLKKLRNTDLSSETIGRTIRGQPEVLRDLKDQSNEVRQYYRDHNVTKELTQSVTNLDYGYKYPETLRHNKHTSHLSNNYIYPVSRKLEERPPQCRAHGTTEMRSAYQPPTIYPRLATDKDQYKHSLSLQKSPDLEPSWQQQLESLDTTHEGFEKLLDPYLTTNKLHHRPFTADQLSRPSSSKEVMTYYTLADIPWIRSRKPQTDWRLPIGRPKSMYDRQTFKQDIREIRTHNRHNWVPRSFRTDVRDNYTADQFLLHSHSQKDEEILRSDYKNSLAGLPTNSPEQQSIINQHYLTESSHVGSGQMLCSAVDQFKEKNKRLESRVVYS